MTQQTQDRLNWDDGDLETKLDNLGRFQEHSKQAGKNVIVGRRRDGARSPRVTATVPVSADEDLEIYAEELDPESVEFVKAMVARDNGDVETLESYLRRSEDQHLAWRAALIVAILVIVVLAVTCWGAG